MAQTPSRTSRLTVVAALTAAVLAAGAGVALAAATSPSPSTPGQSTSSMLEHCRTHPGSTDTMTMMNGASSSMAMMGH